MGAQEGYCERGISGGAGRTASGASAAVAVAAVEASAAEEMGQAAHALQALGKGLQGEPQAGQVGDVQEDDSRA